MVYTFSIAVIYILQLLLGMWPEYLDTKLKHKKKTEFFF
jgi:hypothetical protein